MFNALLSNRVLAVCMLFLLLSSLLLWLTPTSWATPITTSNQTQAQWQLVNYWAISCKPCRAEVPVLNQLAQRHATKLYVSGVNADDLAPEQALADAKQLGIKFPQLTLAQVEQFQLIPPPVLPASYLLNPKGEVVHVWLGEQTAAQFEADLQRFWQQEP